jgi:hypothetical protein
MKTLFLAWQDPSSRAWFPIGRLTHDSQQYKFIYLQGAHTASKKAGFQPIISFPDFSKAYYSQELFPLFQNRLLRSSRPDYKDFIQSLNLPDNEKDPITILSRSGGQRQTDSFEVYPCPERNPSGAYSIHFFAHGLRYFPTAAQQRILELQQDQQLWLMHDLQNSFDSHALMLRTEDRHNVGFCPRYLAQDILSLVQNNPQDVKVTVERINPGPTPLQFRLLCCLTAQWHENFQPFTSDVYQPLIQPSPLSAA